MGLTRADALEWYGDYYAPNNAILILAGDVTPDEARALAETYYGPIPAKEGVERAARPQEPTQRAARRMVMRDARVPQPQMTRSVLVPERNPGDQKTAAALSVLAELLGGSPQTSVLGQKLVMTGKALYAGAGYEGYAVDPTNFYISLAPADGETPEAAEAALDQVLAEFLVEGPEPAQLERIKTQIRAAQIYEQDSAHGRAYEYGQGLATGLTAEDVADWPEVLAAVTAEDVMAAADLVLNSPASVTGWLLPLETATAMPADTAAEVAGDGAASETVPPGADMPPVEAPAAPAADPALSQPPAQEITQ